MRWKLAEILTNAEKRYFNLSDFPFTYFLLIISFTVTWSLLLLVLLQGAILPFYKKNQVSGCETEAFWLSREQNVALFQSLISISFQSNCTSSKTLCSTSILNVCHARTYRVKRKRKGKCVYCFYSLKPVGHRCSSARKYGIPFWKINIKVNK